MKAQIVSLSFGIALALIAQPSIAEEAPVTLAGSALLDWTDEDPSVRIMDGAHAFVERKIAEAAGKAPHLPLDAKQREQFIQDSRKALAKKLGVVDARLPSHFEFLTENSLSLDGAPNSAQVAEGPNFVVYQVRWDVLPGFSAEGLYVNPTTKEGEIASPPLMVLMPDADDTPEDLLGMTPKCDPQQRIALRFALAGFRMLIPAPLNRTLYEDKGPNQAAIRKSAQSHREWIYRQAFQMGRHPLGYEIQSLLAGVDWFTESQPGSTITVVGHGEGGRAALYAAALDTRISHAFISGAFGPRDGNWAEPIYRNIYHLLPDHGDASVAALIAPRTLLVEHTEFPTVGDQKGDLATPAFTEVEREWKRIAEISNSPTLPATFFLSEAHEGARGDFPSVAGFLQAIGEATTVDRTPPLALMMDDRMGFDSDARHERIFRGMQNHVQSLVDGSDRVREQFFRYAAEPDLKPAKWSTLKEHPTLSPLAFVEKADGYRDEFEHKNIGIFDEELSPLNPRTRKLRETDRWTMWEVGLDVYPEMEAWGVLVMPKGIKKGEKRPVVVCQHGRDGVPRDCIDADKTAYNQFGIVLAERGYITYAPHNLYRGEDRYRWLDRKANEIGASLFSFIIASHRQHLAWLKSLPEVDDDHIAFYGLSYGGESAMRIPAILTDYCLSICSGDFNQWTRKVADPDAPSSFMKSIEWEMPYWNLGNTFDYSEMAALIFPRPFFVERGHDDLVSTDSWVAHEYANVRYLYGAFGMADRTGIEFFRGGHSIHGVGSFAFLEKHLGKVGTGK